MSKALDLAKKLHALSQQGEGGERETAAQMLERHMAQHGITLDDLEGDAPKMRYIPVKKDRNLRDLQVQVICCAIDQPEIDGCGTKGKVSLFGFMATDAEFILVQAMLDWNMENILSEYQKLTEAYIISHDLYSSSARNNGQPEKEMSEEETEDLINMMKGLNGKTFRKQLNSTQP